MSKLGSRFVTITCHAEIELGHSCGGVQDCSRVPSLRRGRLAPPYSQSCSGGEEIERVASFTYLDDSPHDTGTLDDEVAVRLAKVSSVFGSLQKSIFQDKPLSIRTKILAYIMFRAFAKSENSRLLAHSGNSENNFSTKPVTKTCVHEISGNTRHMQVDVLVVQRS